jgi:hypothetical protein
MLVAGLATTTSFNVNSSGLSCLYRMCIDFSECNQDCLNRGYKRGGECVGHYPQVLRCCCHK